MCSFHVVGFLTECHLNGVFERLLEPHRPVLLQYKLTSVLQGDALPLLKSLQEETVTSIDSSELLAKSLFRGWPGRPSTDLEP